MHKHKRECMALCREAGLNPLHVEHRGKHMAVVCIEGRVICPCTPSDFRFRHKMKCSARRVARGRLHGFRTNRL